MNSVTQENAYITHQPIPYLDNISNDKMSTFQDEKMTENNNKIPPKQPFPNTDKNVNEVWTKNNFNNKKPNQKLELNLNLKTTKMTWSDDTNEPHAEQNNGRDSPEPSPTESIPDKEDSPAHHARRPMNAFLIFCKKHRPIVREKYPTLENRGVTRILGEWWAQLDPVDKEPYTTLAKDYKDAFLSANPDFKWYKLPAPPLRTLNTRPANAQKPISPAFISPISSAKAEFTPGKLADESHMGGLTSLLNTTSNFNNNNNNNNSNRVESEICQEKNSNHNNNNNDDDGDVNAYGAGLKSPTENLVKNDSMPPKPIKKPICERSVDNKVSRNIFSFNDDTPSTNISNNDTNERDLSPETNYESNMTRQELLNKVVDKMFVDDDENASKETRKSDRSCKGKRYEKFMVEGKLLSNKRCDKNQQKFLDVNRKFDHELHNKIETSSNETPKLDLENTIKRLAERTRYKSENQKPEETKKEERTRSISETSEDSYTKNLQNDFNLDRRIQNLPSLSYDTYVQRKRESKKRKIRPKTDEKTEKSTVKNGGTSSLIGSKKRKNKQSITHLEKPEISGFSTDLSGLATLAEVAANTEKIN